MTVAGQDNRPVSSGSCAFITGLYMQAAAVGKVTVGALTGGYEATRFKEDAKVSPLASVEVLGLADEAAATSAVSTGTALAAGTMLARFDPGPVNPLGICTLDTRIEIGMVPFGRSAAVHCCPFQ